MTITYGLNKCLHLNLVGLLSCLGVSLLTTKTLAQQSNITPDNTLGAESSRLNRNVTINGINADRIDGGAQRGSNLFHSFKEFNINNGQSVYFSNPSGIENILTRVTGGNASNIFGTLGVDGAANLFLINPSGIVFGENASLDLQGSFVGTTASGLQFGEQGNFSTINPQTPRLLTINPSALFFAQQQKGAITANQSLLRVSPGKNLALVGGDISLNGSTLRSFGGNLELGAIGGTATIGINQDGSLSLPENLTQANTSISNSLLNVAADNGGSVSIHAGNLDISGSIIQAGIFYGLGTVDSQAGDITINTTGKLQIAPRSFIRNWVFPNAIGKGGDIRINTDSMTFNGFGSGYISASTWGKGDAGSVVIKTKNDIVLNESNIFSIVEKGAKGNAGNIDITTRNFSLTNGALLNTNSLGKGDAGGVSISTGSLELLNGAQLSAGSFGKGDAGSVEINATDSVKFNGESKNGFPSGVFINVKSRKQGNAGGISISTGSLEVLNGAQISAIAFEIGNAGSVEITATDLVKFSGESKDGSVSGAFSEVAPGAKGKAGGVSISTESLEVLNGAQISASTFGVGDAGSVKITATDLVKFDKRNNDGFPSGAFSTIAFGAEGKAGGVFISTGSLEVLNGAQLSASTFGVGDAGSVEITATDLVKFDGFFSGVGSRVEPGAEGNAGGVSITTGFLEVLNGAQLSAGTLGKGDAGSVEITATDLVKFDGRNNDGVPSGAFSTVESNGKGKAGGVFISTSSLELLNGAGLSASTFGEGNAGSVEINAKTFEANNAGKITSRTLSEFPAGNIILNVTDNITLAGSDTGIFANTTEGSTGKGGSIIIDPRIMTVRDGATISANSQGEGIGGDITLAAGFLILDNGTISAQTSSNTGGNITLNLQDLLLLRNGSQITTTAGTAQAGGDGGNININSKFIVAPQNENSDITANAFSGNGGQVNINSSGIFGIETQQSLTNKSDITASSEEAISGETNINTDDTSSIQNSFTELPPTIDTNAIIANSCIAQSNKRQENSFTITGAGALSPNRPGNVFVSNYTTGEVRTVESKNQSWKKGDPIIEPQGLYRLNNGELLLSRECTN